MSSRSLSSSHTSMLRLEDEPKFTKFNELPKEIRLLIWEQALPGPRIVHLQRHLLRSYDTTRVWSDKSIEDVDDEGWPRFFDVRWEDSDAEEMSDDDREERRFGPEDPPRGFRSQSPESTAPALVFVCRESLEVAARFYTKAFGDDYAFPETWFDFEIDTLYLDWGWHGVSDTPFGAADFGDDVLKVKHLALYNSRDDYQLRGTEENEGLVCEILDEFCNLETLTLVNRRHDESGEKTSDLVFMDPMDLLIWQQYRGCNTPDVDMTKLNLCIEELLEAEAHLSQMTIDWGELKPIKTQRRQDRIPPWEMPKINRKIITTQYMKELLELISGGPDKVKKLSALSSSWVKDISRDPVSAFNSVDFTPTQQRMYMEAFVATFTESSVRNIEDDT